MAKVSAVVGDYINYLSFDCSHAFYRITSLRVNKEKLFKITISLCFCVTMLFKTFIKKNKN